MRVESQGPIGKPTLGPQSAAAAEVTKEIKVGEGYIDLAYAPFWPLQRLLSKLSKCGNVIELVGPHMEAPSKAGSGRTGKAIIQIQRNAGTLCTLVEIGMRPVEVGG